MRKLSIVLLLICIPFMTMEASNVSKNRFKTLILKKWKSQQKMPVFIPIEATISDNYIEIQFLESHQSSATLLIQDKDGNIVFHDTVVPEEQMIYKIDLQGFNIGQYELVYIEEDMTFSGEFEVE